MSYGARLVVAAVVPSVVLEELLEEAFFLLLLVGLLMAVARVVTTGAVTIVAGAVGHLRPEARLAGDLGDDPCQLPLAEHHGATIGIGTNVDGHAALIVLLQRQTALPIVAGVARAIRLIFRRHASLFSTRQ